MRGVASVCTCSSWTCPRWRPSAGRCKRRGTRAPNANRASRVCIGRIPPRTFCHAQRVCSFVSFRIRTHRDEAPGGLHKGVHDVCECRTPLHGPSRWLAVRSLSSARDTRNTSAFSASRAQLRPRVSDPGCGLHLHKKCESDALAITATSSKDTIVSDQRTTITVRVDP